VSRMNYHHLYYFWRVANTGNLTQVANEIHLSQSAISAQLKQFQQHLGIELLTRKGRSLILTPEGKQVLAYADDIFSKGEELESLINKGLPTQHRHVSIGVLSNLSRNFVESFTLPLINDKFATFSLQTDSLENLLDGLSSFKFDIILTNHNVELGQQNAIWHSELVSRQAIEIIGPTKPQRTRKFPNSYSDATWVLPSQNSEIRSAFSIACAKFQYTPKIKAETNDMAMLRLLARDSGAFSVMPEVVVRDEIANGLLHIQQSLPDAYEHFYAVTLSKKRVSPHVQQLIEQTKS
jgi:LysR family transcriptional activator of nhaA